MDSNDGIGGRIPGNKITRLQAYLDRMHVSAARLAEASGYPRQTLARWRRGSADIRHQNMLTLLDALRRITGTQTRMDEIFELEPKDSGTKPET